MRRWKTKPLKYKGKGKYSAANLQFVDVKKRFHKKETDRWNWRKHKTANQLNPNEYNYVRLRYIRRGMNKDFYEQKIEDRINEVASTLNEFERDFAHHYARMQNTGNAAIAAGSTAKRPSAVGANTLNRPEVQLLVELLQAKAASIAMLEIEEVIQNAREMYRTALKEGDSKTALTANEQLMRMLGIGSNNVTPRGQKENKAQDLVGLQNYTEKGIEDPSVIIASLLDETEEEYGNKESEKVTIDNSNKNHADFALSVKIENA